MNTPHFEIYRDTPGDWHWRLRAANGRIVADSAEAYASRRNVLRSMGGLYDAVDGVRTAAVPVQEVAG